MALRKSHLYSSLWQSCDQLRGGMDASQYNDYVLTLLFMKYVSDKYAGSDEFADIAVPAGGSFSDMVALKGTKEIGDGINKVIGRLAKANDYLLKAVIDQADFNDETKLGKGKEMQERLTKLVGIFERLDFRANRAHGDDLLGDAYEYLMRHFATQSGKSKGQFYTPAEVSRIMAQVIGIGPDTPQDQTVHDPTCGSGSLLIKAADAAPNGLTIYGQEMDVATCTMARMNMILHGRVAAEIARDNTLANPHFTDGPGQLKRFDFAVANPPFSMKAWSNGIDPANDEYRRFKYGVPPAKNGDYAYLLHLVASLKSTGKGAIIMPHGVLFRGNREGGIRRNLVKRGWVKGVIGLPANLFYGTGIPACIVVIDKENALGRDGIFMIDASKGFRKDGAKNRLRERDIHCIVDVFNEQKDTPGYARMVPLAEIASETNDYNLNIPRYIDSSEPEDLHDLAAHLHGGIPNRDIDALGACWEVFPGLRSQLFSPNGREGYSDARVEARDVRSAVVEHSEFKAYRDRIRGVFDEWRKEHAPRLRALKVGDSPKALIRDLSEDLLLRFAGLPLLDCYAVYQCLMDYWDEAMQDDVYLVATGGWSTGRKVRSAEKGEEPDFSRKAGQKTLKYVGTLIPASIVMSRFFAKEQALVESVEARLAVASERKSEFEEIHTADEGALNGLEGKNGVTKGNVDARVGDIKSAILQAYPEAAPEFKRAKAIVKTKFGTRPWTSGLEDDEGLFPELDVLHEWLEYSAAESDLRKECKEQTDRLYEKVEVRYKNLTENEIRTLAIDDKWLPNIGDAVGKEVERLTGGFVDQVRLLKGRYAAPLVEVERQVKDCGARVESHMRRMGLSMEGAIRRAAMQDLLTGRTRLPGFAGEWEEVALSEIGTTYGGLAGKTRADFGEGNARYVSFLDVLEQVTVTWRRFDHVRVSISESQNRVVSGDVLFNATSETPEDLAMGSVVLVDSDELYLNSFCFGFRIADRNRCDPLFLAYFSRSIPGRKAMYALAQGATRYNLSKKRFLKLELPLPPLPEQQAIATVLSDMDAEITALEHRLNKTRAIKQGMMQQLLTGSSRLPSSETAPEDESSR